jgi:ABC-type transporter Mla MlaB component
MGSSAPNTLELVIWGPIERADLPGLFARVCALLHDSGARLVACDVGGVAADAVAVDALARLALAAQRNRCQLTVLGASEELRELVAFVGLGDVLSA